jgi:hypothetical protein
MSSRFSGNKQNCEIEALSALKGSRGSRNLNLLLIAEQKEQKIICVRTNGCCVVERVVDDMMERRKRTSEDCFLQGAERTKNR